MQVILKILKEQNAEYFKAFEIDNRQFDRAQKGEKY